jgi:hypothetical protein
MAQPLTDAITALTTYANGVTGASDTNLSDAVRSLADGYGGGGSGPAFELIGEWTGYLPEYTNTSTAETTDTGINISNSNYVFVLTVITCDGTPTNNNDWGGLTIAMGGRFKSNRNYSVGGAIWQRKTKTLVFTDLTDGTQTYGSYGVGLNSNVANIIFTRKAHATRCPKIMAGNYTVKAYGLTAL